MSEGGQTVSEPIGAQPGDGKLPENTPDAPAVLGEDGADIAATAPISAPPVPPIAVPPADQLKPQTGAPVVAALVDGPIDPNHTRRMVAEAKGHFIVENTETHARYCQNCQTSEWAVLDGADCHPRADQLEAGVTGPQPETAPVEAPEAV